MGSSAVAGPDFICIGMPKAGTGWLFDQLKGHPDFWMPPTKGLHYLRYEYPSMRSLTRQLMRSARSGGAERAKGRPVDERDLLFLQEASAFGGQRRDVARYAELFRHKNASLSGEITAAYADLKDAAIAEIAEGLPNVKIILLVRDPVARASSHISMEYRRKKFDPELLDRSRRLRLYLRNSPSCGERSFPTKIVERWRKHAPKLQFHHVLFDDIANEPEKARRDILLYLGADPEKPSGELPADYNRKSTQAKLELTERAKRILIQHFEDELHACAELFGSHAKTWAARYGL